jgi:hypothetical protein
MKQLFHKKVKNLIEIWRRAENMASTTASTREVSTRIVVWNLHRLRELRDHSRRWRLLWLGRGCAVAKAAILGLNVI